MSLMTNEMRTCRSFAKITNNKLNKKKTQTNYFRTCTWATCCYFLILICSWNGFHVVIYLIVDAYACQPIRVWAYWIVFQWVNYRYWTQCLNLAEKYLSKIAFNHTLKWCYKWFGLVFHFQKMFYDHLHCILYDFITSYRSHIWQMEFNSLFIRINDCQ